MKKLALKLIALLVLLNLSFVSCNLTSPDDEADYITYNFRVVEQGTNKPINNAKIVILQSSSASFGGWNFSGTDKIGEMYSDENGAFSLSVHHTKAAVTSLWIEKEGFYEGVRIRYYHVEDDIALQPLTTIKIHVKNVNPFDKYDRWSGDNGQSFKGQDVDEILYDQIRSNLMFTYSSRVQKNSIWTERVDSIYCTPFDTVNLEIFY